MIVERKKYERRDKDCLCGCGNKVDTYHNKDAVYASQRCQREHDYQRFIAEWKAGKQLCINPHGKPSRYIRRYIIERDGKRCSECGWDRVNAATGKCPLELDHKDGNSHNHADENLRALCPNCHSLTPTFKGANRGNGRMKLRLRMAAAA